jgi:hypothetical protein
VNSSVEIVFSNACGAKAVIFADPMCSLTVKNLFKHGIIMHKSTFDGLRRTVVCADERFRRISAVTSQVNICKESMRESLAAYIDILAVNEKHYAGTVYDILVKKHSDDIVKIVKSIFINNNDSIFLNHYFDIVYLELAFYPKLFVNEIITNIS